MRPNKAYALIILLVSTLSIIGLYLSYFTLKKEQNKGYEIEALKRIYVQMNSNLNFTRNDAQITIDTCLKSDYFKLYHPDIIFEDIYANRYDNDAIRRAIKTYFFDSDPFYGAEKQQVINLPKLALTISHSQRHIFNDVIEYPKRWCIFYKNTRLIHNIKNIAKKSFHTFRLKSRLAMLEERNATRQCLEDSDFYLKSYNLGNESECLSVLNSLSQKDGLYTLDGQPKYLLKSDLHQGYGVKFLNSTVFEQLKSFLNQGELCGKTNESAIVQSYMANPLTLEGHKLEFRVYILVASTDPFILYVYSRTLGIQCLDKYNPNVFRKESHICNPHVVRDYWSQNRRDLKDAIPTSEMNFNWSLEDWGLFLQAQGIIKSETWWMDDFLPTIKKRILYFLKTNLDIRIFDSRSARIFAVDFIMSKDLELKILDFNTLPNYFPNSPPAWDLQVGLHRDTFKVLADYVRLKYQRVKKLIYGTMIPSIKANRHQDSVRYINETLKDIPIAIPVQHNFFYIDIDQVTKNCKPYETESNLIKN